jgi:hypothetical protein
LADRRLPADVVASTAGAWAGVTLIYFNLRLGRAADAKAATQLSARRHR